MSLALLVLAAGEGTRMKSSSPKVLHSALGRPLLGHVLNAGAALNPDVTCVVTGAGRAAVEQWIGEQHPEVACVEQFERRGTGHAVQVALDALLPRQAFDSVVVVSGDTPLLTGDTLRAMVESHRVAAAAATVLTARVPDPAGYGRILRAADGTVAAIVEHRDASEVELRIDEVNSGIYVFETAPLQRALARLNTDNSQREQYLTDVVALINSDGGRVAGFTAADPNEVLGVNDRNQLAQVTALLRDRINRAWMTAGVTIVDPATTWIESDVVLAADVELRPNTHLVGRTAIAAGAIIGPDTTLIDCTVDAAAQVVRSQCSESHIGAAAQVGPFSFLRPGAELHEKAKAGAYVEIKNSVIGSGSKVPHLSYVGDAVIGRGTNIGAASIFVNYDGVDKHRTVVGDAVRIGSDTMLVAPVTIGDGAYTAAGSVITEDVPAGALGVGRARQTNLLGWVRRKRAGSSSDLAAKQAAEPPQETEQK